VIPNAGLIDTDFPGGTTGDPASSFGANSAVVEVSEDGQTYVPLAGGTPIDFDMPSIFYLNAGPYDSAPPANPTLADFGIPFDPAGGLSAFDDKTYTEIVDLFAGSGGGTWLDLSATGLTRVGYVRFSVPIDGDSGNDASRTFELDSVVVANNAVGPAVPEPASLAIALLMVLGVGAFVHRRPC